MIIIAPTATALPARFSCSPCLCYPVCTDFTTAIGNGEKVLAEMNSIQRMKAMRGRILRILYERYLEDPLASLEPCDFFDRHGFLWDDLSTNIHYLHDSGLVELIIGYAPPMFSIARITAKGVDLVENFYEFNLRFPPLNAADGDPLAGLPALVERLAEQVHLTALDGEMRRTLQRDALYLREELARPRDRWRNGVIETTLGWMEDALGDSDECADVLRRIRETLAHAAGKPA